MLKAEWAEYKLSFRFEARTSRNSMTERLTRFIRITDTETGRSGVGECNLFEGLSAEDTPDFVDRLRHILATANLSRPETISLSSVRFGVETALRRLSGGLDSPFTRGESGIRINGLIWMGDRDIMRERIDAKLNDGFKVLKLKIGGIDFDSEVGLLRIIRERYSADALEIRLDANGSFTPENALRRLDVLAAFGIHSLEQPLKAGLLDESARVCARTPVPIALDEELIGVRSEEECARLLDYIHPQFIILKPALCGGFAGCDAWISEAERRDVGWWLTSALESDVGLFAIAEYAASRGVTVPQGLGTGQLYYNNVESPLTLRGDHLWYSPEGVWKMPELSWAQ
ncbi:MAG: o-succinylbenzoate synthase [Muribaculaceae bacterium]|nr:o-succinylbenzoate synthase [Muribaculaceae bacterium]